VGKLADYVVLSNNILTIDPDLVKDATVMKTYVGGKAVYEAP
jgi:predicted amidohydrolase YtcJ